MNVSHEYFGMILFSASAYLGIVKALSFMLKLFIQKFRFFLASIFIMWPIELVSFWILQDSDLFAFFMYVLLPGLFLVTLYLYGKSQHTSFSLFEYIFSFILYMPSHLLLIFYYLITLLGLGFSL